MDDQTNLALREVLGLDPAPQVSVGYTAESLLRDLEASFPHRSPDINESIEQLMWRGGQRSVVDWVQQRLEQEVG